MKKLYTLTLSTGLALALVGCSASNQVSAPEASAVKASDAYGLDVAKVCDVQANGIQSVLDIAKKFNPIAKKHGVEFMRHGSPTSVYIEETQKAIDTKATEVILLDKKKKATKLTPEYAAQRACKFAVAA
jgi:PBP1b-binding outer membrane lipoprotein LpoB